MQQTTLTNNISDFGQKIGGAKKDLARNAMDQISLITDDALAKQPLSKSFPRPDFARMFCDGLISAKTSIKLQFLYDSIPNKPRTGTYRVRRWVEKVMPVIQLIKIGLNDEQILANQPFAQKPDFLNFQNEMNAANWPQDNYNPYPFHIVYPHQFSMDNSFIVAKGNYIKHRAKTVEECVAWIKENAGTTKKAASLKCSLWKNRKTEMYYITPKNKGGIVLKEFTTKDEALDCLKNNLAELERIYKELRTIPEERNNWNRTGADYRNGKDITPEQFSLLFLFRGVEFGNWVTQLERAANLNEAYDALYDLAEIAGVSPNTITLNNQLALAFGARGSGKALAHYEPLKRVINLTKKKGAGSLAHEWFHALDNYLCIKEDQYLLFATENPTTVKNETLSNALSQLRTKIKQTDFYSRSQKIDEYKSKPYWATMVELTARAFEKYVITKLAEKGHINDYLANIKMLNEFSRPDVYPYPTDEEIKEIAPYYDKLFSQIFGALKEEIKLTA